LFRATTSLKFHTEGVGSGGIKRGFRGHHNPGGKNTLRGLVSGVGTDANVVAALGKIREQLDRKRPITRVNLCGWSRGAVTCFKIAHAMWGKGPHRDVAHGMWSKGNRDQKMRNLPVYIFAFDPVPGSNPSSSHMWRHISLKDNVKECVVIVAQHERRCEFAPALPDDGGRCTVDVMPGNHRSILQLRESGSNAAAYYVNLDRCAKFLERHGTSLSYRTRLSDAQVVRSYSQMLLNWDRYMKRAQLRLADRTLKNLDGTERPIKLTGARPDFFVNEHHHRETFRKLYPHLTTELDMLRINPSKMPFNLNRPWLAEMRMIQRSSDCFTVPVLLAHIAEVVPPGHYHAIRKALAHQQ
jgi:hypothetical protein